MALMANRSGHMETVYIGLGSNLSDPVRQLLDAWSELHCLPSTRCLALSSLYLSEPVGPAGQPRYINAAARIETVLSPFQLLEALQQIENRHQRVREIKWGPRTLDLDILLFGSRTINEERLVIPHPQLRLRNFVLAPLLDLDPLLALPDGSAVRQYMAACGSQGLRRWNCDLSSTASGSSL